MLFFCIHISQDSVATCLKRGGIFKDEFVANLLPSRLVKKIWKSDNSKWSYDQEFGVLFFLTHGVERLVLSQLVYSNVAVHSGARELEFSLVQFRLCAVNKL